MTNEERRKCRGDKLKYIYSQYGSKKYDGITKEYIQNNLINTKGILIGKKLKKLDLDFEILYMIFNDITHVNLCSCGNPLVLKNFTRGEFACSCGNRSCTSKNKNRLEKIKQTNLERYGDTTHWKNPEIQNKSKETRLKKYGAWKSREATKQAHNTRIKNNNGDYFSVASLQKTKETRYTKYGSWESKQATEKRHNTYLDRYGYIPLLNCDRSKIDTNRPKAKASMLTKYGELQYTNIEKRLETITSSRYYKDLEEHKKQYRFYSNQIRRLTEENINKYSLKDIELRGKDWHLDHKYSIYDGFKNNVPVYIIAHIQNLEIISQEENSKKQRSSSVSLEDLLESIELKDISWKIQK